MTRLRIIGIGSPFGDDRLGLEAAARLASAPPPGCEVVAADRPGVALLELFTDAGAIVLIDAVRSGAAPGTVHDLTLEAVPAAGLDLVSSHGLGVGETLALARALDRLPSGRLLGVETAWPPDRGMRLSAPVEAGLARALERLRGWLDEWRLADTASEATGGRSWL